MELTTEQIEEWKTKLSSMGHEELAYLYRFSPPGHPVFISGSELYEHFRRQFFEKYGGMTPDISKAIGWDGPRPDPS